MAYLQNVTIEHYIYGYVFFGAPPVRDIKNQW